MKAYQKAEIIAKNLPTGSYAAGCPLNGKVNSYDGQHTGWLSSDGTTYYTRWQVCRSCEVSQ